MNLVLFSLIRSGLYGTELSISDLPNTIDWGQLMELIKKHTVEGLVADAVMRLPSDIVPNMLKKQLMETAFSIAKSHSLLDQKVIEVVNFYRNHNINSVLLKGQGIARCYRNPTLRQCGDIDLYVGNIQYDKACSLAKDKLGAGENIKAGSEKHYHFTLDKVTIELHRLAALPPLLHKKDFNVWISSELEDRDKLRFIDIKGEAIPLPSPLFDAFFIFYHAWWHLLYGGIGLRQICDWTMILYKYSNDIELNTLESLLHKYNLMKPWQTLGYIGVNQLGLPQEKMPFYNSSMEKRSLKVLDFILECGNFGFYYKKSTNILKPESLFHKKLRVLKRTIQWYTHVGPIIPMEASYKFITEIPGACIRTMVKLISKN